MNIKLKIKNLVSLILIISMVVSNHGVNLLANNLNWQKEEETSEQKHYNEEFSYYDEEESLDEIETTKLHPEEDIILDSENLANEDGIEPEEAPKENKKEEYEEEPEEDYETSSEYDYEGVEDEDNEEEGNYNEGETNEENVEASSKNPDDDKLETDDENVGESNEDKEESSNDDKVDASNDDNTGESSEDNATESSEDGVGASSEDGVGASSEDNVGASSEDNVGASSEENVGASSEDNVGASSEDNVGASSEDGVGASSASPNENESAANTENKNHKDEIATESEATEIEETTKEQKLNNTFDIATVSEIEELVIATISQIKEGLFAAEPINGDGTHVHKICGVAADANCLHTEISAHTEVGDYRLIAADEDDIMAEIIDDLIGRVDDGLGNYENVVGAEYLYLGSDIAFDKTVDGNPRDADTTTDYYTVDLVRDLYLCLNGHSIKNLIFKSTGNYQLFITNCSATNAVISVPTLPANNPLFYSNTKLFGVNKNITINIGMIISIDNATKGKSTFYGVIFDGYNTTRGSDYVFNFTTGGTITFENCEFANYKNSSNAKQATALLRYWTVDTLVLKNVDIHDNDGISNHIILVSNASNVGRIVIKGRCNIYDNNMSTGTGNANFLHLPRVKLDIEDEGLFIYNNKKTPGARLVSLETSTVVTINEGSTLSIDNNKLAKATTDNNTMFIYLNATINAYGNLYVTNNKVINCGTYNTGSAVAGISAEKNFPINLGNGIIKVENNIAYSDDGVNVVNDAKYGAQHMYQIYTASKDTSSVLKMMSGYKFNPQNRIGNIGFPNGQSGKIMRWTSDEVNDLSILTTVFKVDTYYFKDYVIEVKDEYARAVHRESDHKHKECGIAVGETCTHKEVAAHTAEIMYYELSGDLAVTGRINLIKGFSSTDATEYFYLSADLDYSTTGLSAITLLRDVYICLNGYNMKGVRFAKGAKTVRICNCKNNTVTLRTYGSGEEAYMFDCNAYLYGKENKNIILNTYGVGRINAGYGDLIYIYGTDIDSANTTGYSERSRAYVNKKGGHFIMENVDLHNCHTATQRFMYLRGQDKDGGVAGGKFTIRDVNSYDMSNLYWQIVKVGGASGAEGVFTIKGNCSFNNIKIARNDAHLVYCDGYSSMILDEGATLSFNGNTVTSGADCMFKMVGANAKLRMREKSKLIIENNILGKTTANQGFLLFDSGTHYLYGDIEITDNKFYNCQGKKSDYIGALLASKDATLQIGNGRIFIDNNKAYLDQGVTLVDDRAVPQHHMYGFVTGKTTLALTQASGTKFNPNTYIPDFAFMGYETGNVVKWTLNEYEDYYKASFSEMIIADTTYTPDFRVVHEGDYLVVKSASTHYHKVCGVAAGATCLHTEIAKHTANYQWSAARVDSVDAFVQSMTGTDGATGSSYYYLSDDITATSITTITPKRDVYLCLSGHNMKGFKFAGSKSIYITNCKTNVSTIENTTTNLTFQANTYIYGVNRNIFFHTNRLCDVSNSNIDTHIYSITVDGTSTSTGDGKYATLWTQNDTTKRSLVVEDVTIQNISGIAIIMHYASKTTSTKVVMKNTEVKNCATFQPLLYIENQGGVVFKGNNAIHDCKHTADSNMFNFVSDGEITVQDGGLYIYNNETTGNGYTHANFGKKFTIAEKATLSFVNNKINKYSKNISTIVYVADAADLNFKGNFEVRDNKIVNAGTQTNNTCSAVYVLAKNSIKLGSGRVIIKDNKSYKDNGVTLAEDSKYVAQHMFNLLTISKNANIFSVISGYKLNPETRVEGAAFYSASGVGKVVDWNTNVTSDLNAYKNMFIADKFFNPILDRKIRSNTLVLDYADEAENAHNHKLCGVSSVSTCTHTQIEAHDSSIAYKPLGPNVMKDETIMNALLTDTLGASTEPNYFYLTEDLVNTGSIIQTEFTVDTYICLNGHTIKGFELRANSTSTMNVTNCSSEMGVIDVKGSTNIAFTTNVRAYGVNKNITIYAPRLCWATTNLNEFYSFILDGTGSSGYSTNQWGIIHGGADNSGIKMEKVEIKNIASAWSIVDLPNRKNFEMVMKDVAFKNCKIVDVPFYIVGTDNTLKLTIKGTCDITDNNFIKSGNTNGMFQLKNARLTLNGNSSLNISNNTMTNHGRLMSLDSGYFYTNANSSFIVTGNIFSKNTSTSINSGNTELVQIGASNNCTMLGNVTVTDNKIVNCGTNAAGTYMSALSLLGSGNSINVGNGVITVEGNKAYSDAAGNNAVNDTSYKNHHLFQVYSYNTNLIFKQTEGTKFNTNSRMTVTMQGIAEGKVCEWNTNTTDNVSAYSTIFKTDYFGDEDPMYVVYKDNSVQLVSAANFHYHKVCGIATNSTCTHTLVTTRHDNVEFSKLGATINADTFVSLITGVSGTATEYFYLRGDITTTSEKLIALQRDVYLCLNGYSISGFRFSGKGRKIYICNCKENKVSTIKNILGTSLLFATNVQIYASTRSNVVVNSGRIIDVHSDYANNSCAFYNVTFDATGSKDTKDTSTFYLTSGYTTSFEECTIQNYLNTKYFLFEVTGGAILNTKNVTIQNIRKVQWSLMKFGTSSAKGTLNIDGYLDILNCQSFDSSNDYFFVSYGDINIKANSRLRFNGNMMSKTKALFALLKNGNLNCAENSKFEITNNSIEKNTASANTGFFLLSSDAKDPTILGDYIIENNKILMCGTSTTGSWLFGVEISNNRVFNFGSGVVRIRNNTSHKDKTSAPADDNKYKNHHMYQIYANYSTHKANGIIKIVSGHKFNPENRITGITYDAYNYNGNVIKWDTNTVDEADLLKFREIFTADSYKDDELDIGYDAVNGFITIEFGKPKHRHKSCGVATNATCLHKASYDHGNEDIGYRKISAEANRTTLTTTLTQGGEFVLLDDINPANLGDGGAKYIEITLSNNLYLCLNGHSLKGIRFINAPTKTVIITNCQSTKATIEYGVNTNAFANNVNVHIYGINKNINIKQDKFAYLNGSATNNQNIHLYSINFTKCLGTAVTEPYIYIANGSSYSSTIEDCDFSDLKVKSFINMNGQRSFVYANNNVKNVEVPNYFMSFESGIVNAEFRGTNTIDNIKYANSASDYFIHFANYKDNKIKIDGNFTISNCVSYYNSNHFFHIGQGQLTITEGSSFKLQYNQLYNTAIYSRAMLYLGSESKMSCLGDLIIANNAFRGTRKSHSDVGLLFSNSKEGIEIGNTKIIIASNSTSNAKANIRNLYSYCGDHVLVQKSGTKFNSIESRIDSVAINSEDYTGFIYKTWNEENVTDYHSSNPLNVFSADTYAGRKGMIVKQEGDKVILTFADHFHKLCGILATMSCTHKNGIDHGISDSDLSIMRQYTSLTWENMDDLKRKLSVGGDYFLIRKVKFTEPTVINLENDLYLCLRALYIENVIFTSDNGSTAYITSCIEEIEEGEEEEEEEEEEITEDGETISSPTANMGSKRNDRGEIAIVATASNLQTVFKTSVEVYSPYSNITIYANKLFEDDETKDNNHLILQGVRLVEDEEIKSSNNDYLTAKNVKEMIFENVTISTFSQVNNFIKGNVGNLTLDSIQMNNNQINNSFVDIESGVTGLATRSFIKLSGNSKVTDNTFNNFINSKVDLIIDGKMDLNNNYFEESIMNINAKFEVYENGNLKINSNDIKRNAGDQSVIYVATSSIAIGNIDISENNLLNANASNNSGYVSMFRLAGTDTKLSLGNGVININNNYIDVDENRFKYHHLYSLLMDNADFPLNLYGGQTLNTNSKITLSLKNPYLGGLFKNFPYDDQNIVDAMFIVDENEDADTGFNRARIAAYYENGDVTLDAIYIVHYHANLESLRKPLKIFGKEEVVTKAYYDQPFYVDGQVFNVNTKRRWIEFYMTQDNSFVSLGQHEKGLNPKEKHLHLYASWSPSPTYKDEWVDPNKRPDRLERETHIKDGLFLKSEYGFWMYVMDVNADDAEAIIEQAGDHEFADYNREKTAIYLKNAAYSILENNQYNIYKFGQYGDMETGFVDINDSRYYFEESGKNEGAMRFEPLIKDEKKYIFDSYGRLVKIIKLGTDQVMKFATPYNYHIGFDYYPQIPALVGWREKLFEEILVRKDAY